jgi:hypothetical protein
MQEQLKLSISDKGSWHCLINLSFMRTISRYNNNEIPLTSSSGADMGPVLDTMDHQWLMETMHLLHNL